MKRTFLSFALLAIVGLLAASCTKKPPPDPGPPPPGFESPQANMPRGAMPPELAKEAAAKAKDAEKEVTE